MYKWVNFCSFSSADGVILSKLISKTGIKQSVKAYSLPLSVLTPASVIAATSSMKFGFSPGAIVF